MNIYISGPIKGVENYREKFERAKRIIEKCGHKAINPAGIDFGGLRRELVLEVDLTLVDSCDAIFMLKGWEESCGANREYGYALAKGKDIMFEGDE